MKEHPTTDVIVVLDADKLAHAHLAERPDIAVAATSDKVLGFLAARAAMEVDPALLNHPLHVTTRFPDGRTEAIEVLGPLKPGIESAQAANIVEYDVDYDAFISHVFKGHSKPLPPLDAYRVRAGRTALVVVPEADLILTVPANDPDGDAVVRAAIAARLGQSRMAVDVVIHTPSVALDQFTLDLILESNDVGAAAASERRNSLSVTEAVELLDIMLRRRVAGAAS